MTVPVAEFELIFLVMAMLVRSSSFVDDAITSDAHSNPADRNGTDGTTSKMAKGKATCGDDMCNPMTPTHSDHQLLPDAEWVEDSSTCSPEVQPEGRCGTTFYDKLAPLYKPFPEEEATVAELLRDTNFRDDHALLVHRHEEASAAALSLKGPPSSRSSEESLTQKNVRDVSRERSVNSSGIPPPDSVHSPLVDNEQCSGPKRKRDTDEVCEACTSDGRKKHRTNERGYVTPSVVPAFNWESPEGFTAMNAYLISHHQPLRSEALTFATDTEDPDHDHLTRSECDGDYCCSCGSQMGSDNCCYGSKMVAGEMQSWIAFKLQHLIRSRNGSWITVLSPADELQKTLLHWHTQLKLDNPFSCKIALHMFHRRVHTLESSLNVTLLLAVSLWVAVKLVDNIAKVPKASVMAAAAGVPVKLLTYAEFPLLDSLRWKLVCY